MMINSGKKYPGKYRAKTRDGNQSTDLPGFKARDSTQSMLLPISVFCVGIISSLIAIWMPETKAIAWIIAAVTIIYLSAGWYLFRAYFPSGGPVTLFGIGYFYSSVFAGIAMTSGGWPLADTFRTASLLWAISQSILILILRKRISARGLTQFIIEAFLLAGIATWTLLKN